MIVFYMRFYWLPNPTTAGLFEWFSSAECELSDKVSVILKKNYITLMYYIINEFMKSIYISVRLLCKNVDLQII